MESLQELVRGYLESAGFRIIEERPGALVADKLLFQDRDTVVVWTVPDGTDLVQYAATLRGSIAALRASYPDAKGFLLTRSPAGISRALTETLRDSRIRLLAPIQFFDASFRHEESPKSYSAIGDLLKLGAGQMRIPQPYRAEDNDSDGTGEDLFDLLMERLNSGSEAGVHVVVGRAGIGKTFLFRSVYSQAYKDFQIAKSRRGNRPRPIPFMPEYLKGAYALRTSALVDSFLRTDVATPVARPTFEWLVTRGFTSWFFDGLDELYGGDPEFFQLLLEIITRPGSKAQIIIFCRDSLLTMSDQFEEFRDLCSTSPGLLHVYRLNGWERPSKRRYAWLTLEGREPKTGENDSQRVGRFLNELDVSTTLRSLSELPFYCQVLVELFKEGQLREFPDDAALLSFMVDRMIAREVNKGVIDQSYFDSNGLNEWLEEIAVTFVEDRRYSDIDRSDALALGELVLRASLDEDTKRNVLISLLQFPLFEAGPQSGRITFTHDLIANALAARAYLRTLKRKPEDLARRLSRTDLQDPSLLRFMAYGLDAEYEKQLSKEIVSGDTTGRGFAVLLTLLMLARPSIDLVKKMRPSLDRRDLAGIRFSNRDLSGLSFQGADLSNAEFRDCDLRDARFQGAFLRQTRFEGKNRLEDAHFGDLARVQSVWWAGKLVEEPSKLREWVARNTGRHLPSTEPCPAALQILHLFGKFITPLGTPRRDSLKRDGLLGGKRYSGAPTSQDCVDAAVRHGYFAGPDFRDRFRRAEGDKYSEMVMLCAESRISDGIGLMLSELCARSGCMHQVRIA